MAVKKTKFIFFSVLLIFILFIIDAGANVCCCKKDYKHCCIQKSPERIENKVYLLKGCCCSSCGVSDINKTRSFDFIISVSPTIRMEIYGPISVAAVSHNPNYYNLYYNKCEPFYIKNVTALFIPIYLKNQSLLY